jgi:AraC family transcriptional regulator, transcriptional activator of pobA
MKNNFPIPTVLFYGDQEQQVTPDLLHSELLITKSKAHHFKIRPHRHHGLSQIFYIRKGAGEANIDGKSITITAPSVIVISEMCVHDFIWSEDVEGYVLSIANSLLEQVESLLKKELTTIKSTLIIPINKNQSALNSILSLIHLEYSETIMSGRSESLSSLVQLLGIWLERNSSTQTHSNHINSKKSDYLHHFNDLINKDFVEHKKVEDYAKTLGITAPYLNNLCQQFVQKSALQLIHDRVLLEAKRYLMYTILSISEIAYTLGFHDPAYFTRFFKRLTKESPKQFRINSINHQ